TPEFLAAAEAGLPRAQYFAGAAYATGAGVERDLVAAIAWWMRAAEQGVAQADEGLARLRQTASGRTRRPPAERQAVEQAFGEYRARLWKDYPGLAREGDEPLGAALLRQGRGGEAVAVLIREAAALSEPAQRLLETLYDQGIDGQLPAHDARIFAYPTSAPGRGGASSDALLAESAQAVDVVSVVSPSMPRSTTLHDGKIGHALAEPDADGVARAVPLWLPFGERSVPAFGLALASALTAT